MNWQRILLILVILGLSSPCFSDVVIRTKDGKEFRVAVDAADISAIEFSPRETASTQRSPGPFDGLWRVTRQHVGCCSYSATEDISFSTDASGLTSAIKGVFLANSSGQVSGTTLTLDYGIEKGAASGRVTLTLNPDGTSFSGTFSDKNGHKGTVRGSR